MTIVESTRPITGGVDTHLDVHVAAALDELGGLLGVEMFATTPTGYAELLVWLQRFGVVELVGVEGTGSYGAGLTRLLLAEDVPVVEVDRPNRQRRRKLPSVSIEQAGAHAGRRTPTVLAHGDLPDAALPGEEVVAQSLGGTRLHQRRAKVNSAPQIGPLWSRNRSKNRGLSMVSLQ